MMKDVHKGLSSLVAIPSHHSAVDNREHVDKLTTYNSGII